MASNPPAMDAVERPDNFVSRIKRGDWSGLWTDSIMGNYNFRFLCMPRLNPWGKDQYFSTPTFFGRNDVLSLFLALVMGLQHSMAMIGGIITPPRLVYNEIPRDTNKEQYLVSAALIVSGFCTILQVSSCKIWGTRYQVGSGLLSVMGISFTFLPIAQAAIKQQVANGKSWDDAYGAVLGTYALCALLEVGVSLLPARMLKRMFSSTVCGIAVFLIGVKLCGSGMTNWGGGAFCGDNYRGLLPPAALSNCFIKNVTTGTYSPATCFRPIVKPLCNTNGFVLLPFGSAEYVGMGLTVLVFMTFIELFGSPFLRNMNVLLSLFFGCFISGIVKYKGNSFWDESIIQRAPGITFLWTRSIKLSIYPPVILPALIGYIILCLECIGDITATEEGGREPTEGPEHEKHIQGGMLADAVNSMFSAVAFSMPTVTFAQNNGIIVLTRCASRSAGYACAFWLLLAGIIAKFGAFFVAIPSCVLGGMTTFLFANVVVSGIKIMCMNGMQRRDRYIALVSLGLGLGVTVTPHWATNMLWPPNAKYNQELDGLRSGIIIMLSTPYCIGGLAAMILHMLLPYEATEEELIARDAAAKQGHAEVSKLGEDSSHAASRVALPALSH